MRLTENIYSQVPGGDILTLPHSIKISKVYWGCNLIIFLKWISKSFCSMHTIDIDNSLLDPLWSNIGWC